MPYDIYLEVIDKIKYTPLWVIHNVYLENKEELKDIILTYHRNSPMPSDIPL